MDVGNYCYVASHARRRARLLGAHWGGEERGHIVSPRGQLVINVFPPRWSAMTSRVPSSWVAVRGACLAFVHIVIIPVSPLVLLVYKYGTPVQRRSPWPTEFKFGTNLFERKFRQRIATNLSPLRTTQRGLILQPRRYFYSRSDCNGRKILKSVNKSHRYRKNKVSIFISGQGVSWHRPCISRISCCGGSVIRYKVRS